MPSPFVQRLSVRALAVLLGAGALTPVSSPAQTGATFHSVGHLPGHVASYLTSISADQRVVVGRSGSSTSLEAVYWTREEGLVGIGDLPGGQHSSEAVGVSADGSVIVGGGSAGDQSTAQAFRWTRAGGMQSLGPMGGSSAQAVSDDGTIVHGFGHAPVVGQGTDAFRWTADTGRVALPHAPGGQPVSGALDATADGSVAVGSGLFEGVRSMPVRWRNGGSPEVLGLPGGGFSTGWAQAVSTDGAFVVGRASRTFAGGPETWAWLWRDGQGFTLLGDLPGGAVNSQATAVSDAGVVVGVGRREPFQDVAFIWDATNGMRALEDVLATDYGLDLAGWTLTEAGDISADGMMIVGSGINPQGQREGFIAVLPEPAGAAFVAAAMAALLCRRSRPRRRP